jgi:hypothetical protein
MSFLKFMTVIRKNIYSGTVYLSMYDEKVKLDHFRVNMLIVTFRPQNLRRGAIRLLKLSYTSPCLISFLVLDDRNLTAQYIFVLCTYT